MLSALAKIDMAVNGKFPFLIGRMLSQIIQNTLAIRRRFPFLIGRMLSISMIISCDGSNSGFHSS